MSVYIDNAFIPFGRMKMCHMIADTEDELHAMARAVGLKRAWFQDHRIPHYDVSSVKRKEAIARGAQEVTVATLIAIAKKTREDQCTLSS